MCGHAINFSALPPSLLPPQEIQGLNMQLRQKELELESVRCQPDHEKDQEIQRLRLALEDRERSEATRAVLCTSLAEEADQLRSQLGATVKVCQELLARLEKEKKGGGEVEEMAQQQNAKEVCDASTLLNFGLYVGDRCLCALDWTICSRHLSVSQNASSFFLFGFKEPSYNFPSSIFYS